MTSLLVLSAAASASALMTPQLSSARASRAAVLRTDDIPMTKPNTGVVPTARPPFACSFEIPKKGIAEYGTCNMNFKPLLTNSELVMVTYELVRQLARTGSSFTGRTVAAGSIAL